MKPNTADILIRSRHTILDILEDRGYNVDAYRNISPDQILNLAEGHHRALDIIVPKKVDGKAPCERAVVIYQLQDRIRLRLPTFTRDLYAIPVDGAEESVITKADDVIVILNEPYNEVFDKVALQMWQNQKARMTFFHIKQIVVNLSKHEMVPPHRKLSVDEARDLMASLHVNQKSQFPLIKHHDIQARILGLVPGDFVEILRPSPTAGIVKFRRICAA
jgi:DNA-directed RNA polymerase subunit H (RpoH/RPB5)